MKRILTIICTIVFSGAALSAQNNADTIRAYMVNVGYDRGYRADVELSWANKSVWGITSSHGFSFGNGLYVGGGAGFSLKAGYEYQLGFWGHLDGKYIHNVKLGVAYTF